MITVKKTANRAVFCLPTSNGHLTLGITQCTTTIICVQFVYNSVYKKQNNQLIIA